MTFRVVHQPSTNPARCPYRVVVQATGREIDWINQYLDYETLRRLADHHPAKLCARVVALSPLVGECSSHRRDHQRCTHRIDTAGLCAIPVRSSNLELTGGTINQRVAIVDHALRIVFPDAPGQIAPGFQQTYWQRAPMGIGRPRLALSRLRVKTPKRTISPLSVDEVARFWSSFRTSRDLGHRGFDAAARTPLPGGPGSESRRSAVAGSADPRARQG